MNLSLAAAVCLVLVLATWALLHGWVYYNAWLEWLAWKLRRSAPSRPLPPSDLPHVTVQLPVYNEEAVVARLVDAVGALDWPTDRLEIQLLDDSTDRTSTLAEPALARLRARGLRVSHLRRRERDGFKAGALRDGLLLSTGEFILILDADFVPGPSLLQHLIPWFADSRVAMVQGQWGHLAPARALIERCAGYWIDRHFAIEQLARSRSGQFFHFNGSCGVWRRTAIEDAGGWQADTLAEDLDLSFRAWQRGWKFVFDVDAIVPGELPASAAALRIQQRRWARGALQVARKAIPRLRAASLRDRIAVSLHLTGYAFPVILLALALTAGTAAWARRQHPVLGFFAVDISMAGFFATLTARAIWQGASQGWRRGWLEVEAAAIGIGLAPLVFVSGLRGLRQSGGEFQRTPKSTRASGAAPPIVFAEAFMGIAALANAAWAISLGSPWIALLPLLAGAGLLALAWRTVRPYARGASRPD